MEIQYDRTVDPALVSILKKVPIFARASDNELQALAAISERQSVERGVTLIRAGEDAGVLYIVLRGRLLVFAGERLIAEIGAGEPAGELGFFAGRERTANVVAARSSEVLAITREDYEQVSARLPGLAQGIMGVMAERLARWTTSASKLLPSSGKTISLVAGGGGQIPDQFCARIDTAARASPKILRVIRQQDVPAHVGDDPGSLANWIAQQESGKGQVLLIGQQGEDNTWNRVITDNADRVFIACDQALAEDGVVSLSPLEQRIQHKLLKSNIHKVVWRGRRDSPIRNTANWLNGREVHLHHHVALDSTEDFSRLIRFMEGQALGLVLCGGGAFGTAHLGAIKALQEAGTYIDLYGGTSVGAAMAAALAVGKHPDEVMDLCEEIFLRSKAMRRLTVPLHSFLDHKRFDEQMRKHYGEHQVEDLPVNFFAVATSLTRNDLHLIRSGKLWHAVRASSSIPAVFPPMIQDNGEVLIDGALVDNVPINVMRDLNSGPNVVLNFRKNEPWRVHSDYERLPGRAETVRRAMIRRKKDQWFPSVLSVLSRTMVITSKRLLEETDIGSDVLLELPTLPKMGFLEWKRGREQFDCAYRAVSEVLAKTDAALDPVQRVRQVAEQIQAEQSG